MTDREMLLMSYGAVKVLSFNKMGQYTANLEAIVDLLEAHLYPHIGQKVEVDVGVKVIDEKKQG